MSYIEFRESDSTLIFTEEDGVLTLQFNDQAIHVEDARERAHLRAQLAVLGLTLFTERETCEALSSTLDDKELMLLRGLAHGYCGDLDAAVVEVP